MAEDSRMLDKLKSMHQGKTFTPKITNVASPLPFRGLPLNIPNHSGDHSAGRLLRTPSNETDLVNKEYVDSITGRASLDLFLTENASDIGTYFDLEVDVVLSAKENIVQSITGSSTTLIASFASILIYPIIYL